MVNCGRCSWQINTDEGRDRLIGFSIQKLPVTLTREGSVVEEEQEKEQEKHQNQEQMKQEVQREK